MGHWPDPAGLQLWRPLQGKRTLCFLFSGLITNRIGASIYQFFWSSLTLGGGLHFENMKNRAYSFMISISVFLVSPLSRTVYDCSSFRLLCESKIGSNKLIQAMPKDHSRNHFLPSPFLSTYLLKL